MSLLTITFVTLLTLSFTVLLLAMRPTATSRSRLMLPTTVTAGQLVTGQITCTNAGPSTAVNATCAIPGLPAGATTACTPATPVASLANGATLVCNVSYTAPAKGTVSATVTAASSTADPNPGNNTLPYAANVTPEADMAATVNLPATAVA